MSELDLDAIQAEHFAMFRDIGYDDPTGCRCER